MCGVVTNERATPPSIFNTFSFFFFFLIYRFLELCSSFGSLLVYCAFQEYTDLRYFCHTFLVKFMHPGKLQTTTLRAKNIIDGLRLLGNANLLAAWVGSFYFRLGSKFSSKMAELFQSTSFFFVSNIFYKFIFCSIICKIQVFKKNGRNFSWYV